MLRLILEAAFRSCLMALAVWAGIRIFRVQAVLAQKLAWVLVLVAAGTMPLVMQTPWLALDRALRIPIRTPHQFLATQTAAAEPAATPAQASPQPIRVSGAAISVSKLQARISAVHKPKPAASHPLATSPRAASSSIDQADLFAEPLASQTMPSISRSVILTPSQNPVAATDPAAPAAKSGPPFWNWARLKRSLIVLYLLIAALFLLRTFGGLAIAFRIWRNSEPVPDAAQSALPALAMRPGHVRVSRMLSTPVTIASTIILPPDFTEWDEAKLRIVLAHEHSHVRQGDFYLQLLAAIHAGIFWFSPLGWWLKRTLSELGEALSDRAGLAQAVNPASYAKVLLEFAGRPRTTPHAGVAMARSSNLSSRIERILNARNFRLAFLGGRRHAILVATLVPAALLAVVACIRIVPAVEAQSATGQSSSAGKSSSPGQSSGQSSSTSGSSSSSSAGSSSDAVEAGELTGQIKGSMPEQVISVETGSSADGVLAPTAPAPFAAPSAPAPFAAFAPPAPPMIALRLQADRAPDAPEVLELQAPVPPVPPMHPKHGFAYVMNDGDDKDSFALIMGKDSQVYTSGRNGAKLEKAKKLYKGDFLWIERDGKSYVITDPEILAKCQALIQVSPVIQIKQEQLNKLQVKLDLEMANIKPDITMAKINGPEFAAQMAKLQAELAELQSDKYVKLAQQMAKDAQANKYLTDDKVRELTDKNLSELQEKIGDIQGRIGEIEGQIGERYGEMGEKQGEIGERMGKIGEEMGRLGEEQGRQAEKAHLKMKSMIDEAIKEGKAKPVE